MWRSAGAVIAGFVAVVVLSTGADMLLYGLHLLPPPDPMRAHGIFALALAYRVVFGVAGSWVAGRLAPSRPMRHALIVGAIGFGLSGLGAVLTAGKEMGPDWYAIALVAVTLPCAWLGGVLAQRQRTDSPPSITSSAPVT